MFFYKSQYDDRLIWNSKLFTIDEIIDRCDTNLLNLCNKVVKEKYSDQTLYAKYITK